MLDQFSSQRQSSILEPEAWKCTCGRSGRRSGPSAGQFLRTLPGQRNDLDGKQPQILEGRSLSDGQGQRLPLRSPVGGQGMALREEFMDCRVTAFFCPWQVSAKELLRAGKRSAVSAGPCASDSIPPGNRPTLCKEHSPGRALKSTLVVPI